MNRTTRARARRRRETRREIMFWIETGASLLAATAFALVSAAVMTLAFVWLIRGII